MVLAVGLVEVKIVVPLLLLKVPELTKLPAMLRLMDGAVKVAVDDNNRSPLTLTVPAEVAVIVPVVILISVFVVVSAFMVMVLE